MDTQPTLTELTNDEKRARAIEVARKAVEAAPIETGSEIRLAISAYESHATRESGSKLWELCDVALRAAVELFQAATDALDQVQD